MKTLAKALTFAATFAAVFFVSSVRAAVEIGKPAADFTFTDIAGRAHRLSDFKGTPVVLEWTNPECPVVKKHYDSRNMQATQQRAAQEGAVWIAINSAGYPGAQGNFNDAEAAAWLKEVGATTTAYFRDQSGKVGRLYGATATPHMFVITAEGVLAYKGAIDSNPSARVEAIPKATNYVTAALGAIKAGRPVEKAATRAYGCSIKYGAKSSED